MTKQEPDLDSFSETLSKLGSAIDGCGCGMVLLAIAVALAACAGLL